MKSVYKVYSSEFDEDEQITAEEQIAFTLFDYEGEDYVRPSEEDCAILSRRILFHVLQEFRPDLFEPYVEGEAD